LIFEELKAQTIDILNRKAKAQNELSATDSRLDYLVTRLDRLTTSAKNFLTEQSQLEAELARLREEVDARQNEINHLTARQNQVNSITGQLQSRVAVLEKNIKEIERERGTKASRLQSLQELQEAYEGYNAGVKAILGIREGKSKSGNTKGSSLGGICGVIAEIVRTEPRYELAVEASLGTSIQDIVTETLEDAKAAVEYLKSRKSGRATLLPMDILVTEGSRGQRAESKEQGTREHVSEVSSLTPSPPHSSLPDGALAAASQVVDFDATYSPVVEYLLGKTLIVEDLDTAVKLARTVSQATPTLIPLSANGDVVAKFATLDGQVVSSAGAITGGTGSEGAGLLRRSREIRDLRRDVAKLDEQLANLTKDRDDVASKISSLQREKEEIAKELQRKQISHTSVVYRRTCLSASSGWRGWRRNSL
jgi:chromosome segregation protein